MRFMKRVRDDERGAALITALLCTMVMLALGLALLAIVDTEASQSTDERTRDRGFNLSESVLNSEAFILGRNWPSSEPTPDPACQVASTAFGDIIGATTPAVPATRRLRNNLNASYTDDAYEGASWQVNICDDVLGSTVWSDALLNNKARDANLNNKVWVRAESTVGGKTRVVVGLVNARTTPVFDAKYGLVSGGLTDDLGATVNGVGQAALGGVLGGLLATTPTVDPDPALTPSGVTGLRCGLTQLQLIPTSTCVSGTIGALGALPVVESLLTGGTLEQFPTRTTASADSIDQLRAQAIASGTYYATSAGSSSVTTNQVCQMNNTGPESAGTPSKSTVVFIEKVGTTGDEYCVVNVGTPGVRYKALVIGSGRVILRGNNATTAAPIRGLDATQTNTFSGIVYGLNLQRLTALGDAASPGRPIVRIEQGAHVLGAVYADGKSAKVAIYPPTLSLNFNALRAAACAPLPFLQRTVCLLLGTVGALTDLLGLSVVSSALAQLNPQRDLYGSAITTDTAAINSLTAYGASGVIPGTFRDLQAR